MSQKYRHQGYRDSDREESRDRSRRGPREELTREERIQLKSLRHAIDRTAREVIRCHVCGRTVENSDVIATDTLCPHCSASLHCCRTCREFDTSARWQCRAEIQAAVTDKNKPNTCPKYGP